MSSSGLFSTDAAQGVSIVAQDALARAAAEGACAVVDVREPHEYEAGHIPGAINQPLSSFDPEALPEGKPIVLVCQAGGRSLRALRIALAAGVSEVGHYPGGFAGWRGAGGEVET
jgi:rhodanese-related sulfurtransferase